MKCEIECFCCEYSKVYTANGGFQFLGCSCPPYKGKWIAEIDKCPKGRLKENDARTDKSNS